VLKLKIDEVPRNIGEECPDSYTHRKAA